MKLAHILNQYKAERDNLPDHLRLRIHRCLSWLKKAENSKDDLDIRFISLWIAFNAAYAKDKSDTNTPADKISFRDFISLINQKASEDIKELVWQKYPSSIRLLLDNQYVFQSFWSYQNGLITEEGWLDEFKKSKQKSLHYLANQDLEGVLSIVFNRLYTLRNQIFHGGSTYQSSANREQLKDACNLLADCLYLFVSVMITCEDVGEWGEPFYPYVET